MLRVLSHFETVATSEEKANLISNLSDSLVVFIDAAEENPYRYFSYDKDEVFGTVLFKLGKFGVKSPSNECLKKIVNLYYINIGRNPGSSDYSALYMRDLDAIAQIFLLWRVDPNNYEEKFWEKFFLDVAEHFPYVRGNLIGRGVMLCTYLHIALEFGQEIEFLKIKFLWIDNWILTKSKLDKNDVATLAAKLESKYGDENKLYESGFKPVLNLLNTVKEN